MMKPRQASSSLIAGCVNAGGGTDYLAILGYMRAKARSQAAQACVNLDFCEALLSHKRTGQITSAA